MQPSKLVLRCLLEQREGYWQAFCLDLNLAVQGDSEEEVRTKLHSQIFEYVHDALVGEDQKYADQLLNRKAPMSIMAKYYFYMIRERFHHARNGVNKLFTEVMPLKPCNS